MQIRLIKLFHILVGFFCLSSCDQPLSKTQLDSWKQEIIAAEKAFAELAKAEGIHSAFVAFAADDAVLMRSKKLIKNKTGIDSFIKTMMQKH